MAILRPSSDLVTGGWTSSPSGTLASCIDETTASDTDYIETTGTGNSSIILLDSGSDPGNDNNHKLSYRASSTSETLTVDVVQMAPAIVTSKQPWRRQPQGLVGIDWSNPLTRRLVSVITPIQGDIFNPSAPTIYGAGAVGPLKHGIAIKSIYTGGGVANEVSYPVKFSATGDRTLAVFAANVGGINGFTTHKISDADSEDSLQIGATSFGCLMDNNRAAAITITGSPTPRLYVGRRRSNQVSAYANGTFTAESVTGTRTLDGTTFLFGRGTESSVPAQTYLSLYWTRCLRNAEILALEKNPWQIFRPRKKVSYFDAPNVIATRTPSLTSSPSDQTIDLTSGEAATITDYTKLGLRFRT